MTISEALTYSKSLFNRHSELVGLRDENSKKERRFFGSNAEREVVTEPLYNVKELDKKINIVAKEMRLIDMAIKSANATTQINYTQDETVWDSIE